MTIASFCKRTGWPLEEFMNLGIRDVTEILSLYDLVLTLV